ncbi:transglutaminase domain protein [Paenibacillus curdlanolyticus YK9]|uniref:Transglutaminase domain protein n=1 Tax=Paenibacillus curdlanolyticus YK9 TaxID=717606 RepID=E0I339_9BACL|nr:transglutaminase domain-containing protein [Paenibacillus curdlanolyticus]EFM12703.1 transglutaminase domain protein [Paenibacillus curdlanolyticus YK9]
MAVQTWRKAVAASLQEGWYRRVVSVLTALMAWQLAHIFEGYWWEETFQCVSWVLFTSVALEWVLPWRPIYRVVTQGAVLVFISARVAQYTYISGSFNSLDGIQAWISDNASQLHPIVGLAALVWGAAVALQYCAITRRRIMAVLSMTLLTLMIADSFTPVFLWDQTAWAVFAGLGWLIAEHYSRFQREHPRSWSELLEYPISFFLPIVSILTAIMLVGVLAPNLVPSVAPILKDPYTIWVEAHGGKVSGSFTETRMDTPEGKESSGDHSSGYSRNDSELGGGFKFDYSPVMYVSTTQRSYWRGETRAYYTGAGWMDDENDPSAEVTHIQSGEQLPLDQNRDQIKTVEVKQAVTMIREDQYPVLFAAVPVESVLWINDENRSQAIPSSLRWDPMDWELRWGRPNADQTPAYPRTYAVVSELPVLNETSLRQAKAGWSGGEFAPQLEPYVQLPDTTPKRVKQLAEEITAAAGNDYDKAKLIQTFLQENYTYTNEPNISLRQSQDFVDSFLFEVKEGYCDYFSTAMAVLGRSVGLPVRWVKGYAPGILPVDPTLYINRGEGFNPDDINPNGEGTYTVRNADAHSWVEIYFDGYGWIPFEPTPGFDFPYPIEEQQAVALPDIDLTGSAGTSAVSSGGWGLSAGTIVWLAAALVAIVAVYLMTMRRQQLVKLYQQLRYRSVLPNDRIVIEANRLLRHARRKGYAREEWETLRESAERWGAERNYLRTDLKEVANQFEQVKYGAAEYGAADAERFAKLVKSIRDRM